MHLQFTSSAPAGPDAGQMLAASRFVSFRGTIQRDYAAGRQSKAIYFATVLSFPVYFQTPNIRTRSAPPYTRPIESLMPVVES